MILQDGRIISEQAVFPGIQDFRVRRFHHFREHRAFAALSVTGNDIPVLILQKGFLFFQKFLRERGILKELTDLGIQEGDTVRMYGLSFDYYPE